MISVNRSRGWRRYLTTNSTQADFTTLTPVLVGGFRTDFLYESGELFITPSGNTASRNWKLIPREGRGVHIRPFGAGADNDTGVMRVWGVEGLYTLSTGQVPDPSSDNLKGIFVEGIGSLAVTLSAAVGAAGLPIAATDRLADTLTWTIGTISTTPKGVQTSMENAYALGSSAAYSPTGDQPARLIIPDLGPTLEWLLLEFDRTGTTTAMNALYNWTE